jgi:hypothetical protein
LISGHVRTPCAGPASLSATYAYLLGAYLGDGSLSHHRRDVWRLRITSDVRYPRVIARCLTAIREVRGREAAIVERKGCVDVSSYWRHWRCVFPQHGPGRKHSRAIRLQPWQMQLVEKYTPEFLAGLIDSDGCRVLNRVSHTDYPRYFFSNLSADIQRLFLMACGMAGIECRRNRPNSLSIARRGSVRLLDELIGGKA